MQHLKTQNFGGGATLPHSEVNMDKVKIEVKKGEAIITEGGDSFIGQLISKAGKVRIHRPGINREVQIVEL